MEKLIIESCPALHGEVVISGAKNSSLPILAATILAAGRYHISNIPALRDINTMFKLLKNAGIESSFENNSAVLINNDTEDFEAPYELLKTMRASILLLCQQLAKKGKSKVSLPGGCAIGERPVDLHIAALEKMGAKIEVKDGYIFAECEKLTGIEIIFDKVTVTGTENIMMAAAIAEGTTILKNAAQEPEVQDLADFLRKMGAEIEGDGTNTITIHGVSNLHSADHQVMADRIEAGTFLCAVAGAGGDITLKKCPVYALDAVIEKLRLAGLEVNIIDNETINAKMNGKIKAVNVQTAPYPAFPTDMQAQFMAVMLKSDGVSVINESIFENRFMHVPELKRMGADISLNDSNAVVKGVTAFSGAPVMASDLRASAGLVIAALMADHTSSVHRIYHLDRGYEGFEKKLNSLGAKIVRTEDNE